MMTMYLATRQRRVKTLVMLHTNTEAQEEPMSTERSNLNAFAPALFDPI